MDYWGKMAAKNRVATMREKKTEVENAACLICKATLWKRLARGKVERRGTRRKARKEKGDKPLSEEKGDSKKKGAFLARTFGFKNTIGLLGRERKNYQERQGKKFLKEKGKKA